VAILTKAHRKLTTAEYIRPPIPTPDEITALDLIDGTPILETTCTLHAGGLNGTSWWAAHGASLINITPTAAGGVPHPRPVHSRDTPRVLPIPWRLTTEEVGASSCGQPRGPVGG
jgi:hypothetical protein